MPLAVDRRWRRGRARSPRRSLVAIEEDVHEQCFQARRIVIDLVILPGLAPRPVLQPVERALFPGTGHRRTVRTLGLELAGQHMEQRVVTKLIVVVQVFIAEREGEHALADQGLDRVLEQSWVAPVGETAGHPTDQPEAAIQPPQQQPSGIRRHRTRPQPCAVQPVQIRTMLGYTLFASGPLRNCGKRLANRHFPRFPASMHQGV